MGRKPTFEELEQRIRDLEGEVAELRRSDAAIPANREIVDAMIDGVIVFDFDYRVISTNQAWLRMVGLKAQDVIGKNIMEIPGIEQQNQEDLKTFLPLLKEATEKGSSGPFELIITTKDKRKIPVSIAGGITKAAKGDPNYIVAVIRDITTRKQAEEALQESEERLKSIIDNTTSVIYLKDRHGKYILINRQYETLFHITKDQIIGKTDYDVFPEEMSNALRENDRKVLEVGGPLEFEEIVPHDDGIHTYISIKFPLRDSSGVPYGVCGISTDVTARKQAEEQIHTLTQELIASQENERQRISHELHDSVAQELSAAKIACGLLLNKHPELDDEVRKKVSDISDALLTTISAVRDLSYGLRPPGLTELGLIQSIFQHCEDFSEKYGIDVDFQYTGIGSLRLNLEAEINIFRIIQEALSNIRKHADVKHATVRLVGAFPNIILRIEDNGKGFDVEQRLTAAIEQKRMGFRSMEERVNFLQGQMNIHSKPEVGTIISIKFPYKKNG